MTVPTVIKNVVEAARVWRRSRGHYRRLADSRSTTKDVLEKAQQQLIDDSKRLEQAVDAFEKLYADHLKRNKKPIPWGAMLRGALKTAHAVEQAISKAEGSVQRVIDVDGEVVSPPKG